MTTTVVRRTHCHTEPSVYSPVVWIFSAFATAEDSRRISCIDTSQRNKQLCGLIAKKQISSLLQVIAQHSKGCRAAERCRQLVPSVGNADTVNGYPKGCNLLGIDIRDVCRGKDDAIRIMILKPLCSGTLVIIHNVGNTVITDEHTNPCLDCRTQCCAHEEKNQE